MSLGINPAYRDHETIGTQTDDTGDKPQEFLHELLTIPNLLTGYRLSQAPWAYKAMRDNPGANWGKLTFDIGTDLEGNLARLSRLPVVGKYLAAIGFRSSKYGRILDPVADYAYGAAATKGLNDAGVLPAHLTKAMLAQKAHKGALTVAATAKGIELHVSNTGAAGEAATVGSIVAYARSDAETETKKRLAWRASAYGLGVAGLALSSMASLGYTQDAGFVELPESVNDVLDSVNRACGRILPGRQAITHAEYLAGIGQTSEAIVTPDTAMPPLGDRIGEYMLERLV